MKTTTLDTFTAAKDIASWNRHRTSEELQSFVAHRLGVLATRTRAK